MKIKLRLKESDKILCDPETKITWTGNKIIESEITTFVASAIGRGILEIVEEKADGK